MVYLRLYSLLILLTGIAAADWLTFGGDPQRTSWARNESILNKQNVGTMEMKFKLKLDNAPKELTSLMQPVVIDQVKTPRGIKEFVIVAGSSDTIHAVDADSGKLVWRKSFTPEGTPTRAPNTLCPFAVNATPVIDSGRGRFKTIYMIASDGKLHALDAYNGEDRFPPTAFVPAFSKNWSLNLYEGVLYTAISQRCNGVPSSVYSMDLNVPEHPIHSFEAGPTGAGIWGRGGVAISPSGKIYAITGDGPFDPANGKFSDTILALSAKDLKLVDYYTPTNREWLTRKDLDIGNVTPVVFPYKDREYVVGAGKEGRLYLMQSGSLGGETHRKPLWTSPLMSNEDVSYSGHGFWGAFATWEDEQAKRWIFAPTWGPPHPSAGFHVTNGEAPHGSIMAFRMEMKDGWPVLNPAWVSRDMDVPEPPIIANGVLFALSSGEDVRQFAAKTAERLAGSRKTILYALDAETGKELYSSGELSSFTHFGGLAISNGRVFVSTYDGCLYAFGLKEESR